MSEKNSFVSSVISSAYILATQTEVNVAGVGGREGGELK